MAINTFLRRVYRPSARPIAAIDSLRMNDLFEGAGGSPAHLGRLVVAHLRFVQADQSPVPLIKAFNRGLILFLINCQRSPELPPEAFLSCSILGALADTISALTLCGGGDKEAIKDGLLTAIVACGNGAAANVALTKLKPIFNHLAAWSIQYRPLCLMRHAVAHTTDLAKTKSFTASAVANDWAHFVKILSRRLALLDFIQSKEYYSVRGCDDMTISCNQQCGEIVQQPNFKHCGGCRHQYYCSETCQRNDWRVGGHRTTCSVLAAQFRLRCFAPTNRVPGHGPRRPYYTSFDYASDPDKPAVEIRVLPRRSQAADWETCELIARAARSGGMMELHQMSVGEGAGTRARWFPARHESGAMVWYGIAERLPVGVDMAAIREPILEWVHVLDEKVDEELLEVH
ncbi:hypothetical protein C8R43DRAFT_1106477 [Mycena crocata]|nr:hypothetical protein C8R43DRAFT_1106477 [Mycena crocata]